MTFFSIVVPTRNRPTMLRCALLSIREQTFQDYEVVIIDDGSDEEAIEATEAMVSELGDRFRLARRSASCPTRGPGAARNEGVRLAQGQYVGFLDDDDHWCDPDHLRQAAECLRTASDIDVFVANQTARRGDDTVVSRWLPHLDRVHPARTPIGETEAARVGLDDLLRAEGIGFAHVNMILVRRQLVLDVGGFWSATTYEEDLDFFIRLVDGASAFAYRPATVSVHAVRSSSDTEGVSSIGARAKALFRVVACLHAELACERPETRRYARLLQGGVFKTMAKEAYQAGDIGAARDLARRAVAADPSARWWSIALGLKIRSMIGR